ncbi:MAG TPA: phosphoribosylglycinamide formyltransferase [Oribacterium sp.]|jgi:phosphoribosylglycinamide formyltransferase-1|nr:phosphoribosylglycinamide formyltransferase [Oribacterium sp.]
MNQKTKIAVLVSGGGTNLQALIDAQSRGEIPDGEIRLVVGSRDGIYALERAEQAGIEHVVVHKDEPKLLSILEAHDIELIILAGYLTILSENFTKKYANRIINIHPSLIPSFCGKGMYGLKPHEAALAYGVKVTGATVHLVNEIPDGGRILLQKAVEIKEGDTAEILQKRVMEQAEWKLLPKAAEMMSLEIRNQHLKA